jgi:hypothetical protein
MASLLRRYIGMKKESVWGTAVVVDRFWPVLEVSADGGPSHDDGEGIYAGEYFAQVEEATLGDETWNFETSMQVYDHAQGLLYEAMLGTVSQTGAGPFTRTFKSLDPLPSYTVQEILIDALGVARARTWTGCKVGSWELKIEAGKILTLGLSWSAKSHVTNIAAATNAIPTSLVPVQASRHLAVTAFGGAVGNCKAITLSGDNKLTYDERRFVGSPQIGAEQVSQELRVIEGDLELELADNFTWWGRVVAGTFGALQVAAVVGSNSTTIDLPKIKAVGEQPNQANKGIAEQPVKFRAYGQLSALVEPITITTVNSDVAA